MQRASRRIKKADAARVRQHPQRTQHETSIAPLVGLVLLGKEFPVNAQDLARRTNIVWATADFEVPRERLGIALDYYQLACELRWPDFEARMSPHLRRGPKASAVVTTICTTGGGE